MALALVLLVVLLVFFLLALVLLTAARPLSGRRPLLLSRTLLTALFATLLAALAFRAIGARRGLSVGPLVGRR
jgi:hypothetical protein